MAVSARDIARKAGVSQQTVSSVINNNPRARISVATQDLVRRTASEMGYSPNHLARSLVTQRTNTIGLMISDLENPFFVNVLRCAESLVREAGYQILLDANTSVYGEYHELRNLAGWLVDGVLIWTIPNKSLEQYLGERARHIPVVYLGHLREDGGDAVAMDLHGAGRQATEHLLARGYRRLCYITNFPKDDLLLPDHQIPGFLNNQVRAFQDICREAGLEPEVVDLDRSATMLSASFRMGLKIAGRPPSKRPDALICHNDSVAHYICLGLMRGGLQVPDDIALVGFDGIEEGELLPNGPLTTVRMPVEELCREALDILLKRIGGDNATPPRQVLIPTELRVGCTT